MNSDEIKAKVEEIVKASDVTFEVVYRGETERESGDPKKPWGCDEWSCTFRMGPKSSVTLPYFTGLGCRKRTESDEARWRMYLGSNPARKGTLHYESAYKSCAPKPNAPHVTDVLYSLVSDAQAEHMSFSDWCSDFGYDDDSIKALNIYRECGESAKKLRMVFTSVEIKELREALQDY
jgi:hypothetical protein